MGGSFRPSGGLLVLSAVAVVVVFAVVLQEASAQLCPLCECPPAYQPVCGKTIGKDGKVKVRGFPSRCIMECNNQCRTAQFEFLKRGRCGPKKPKPVVNGAANSVLDKEPEAAVTNATGVPPKGLAVASE